MSHLKTIIVSPKQIFFLDYAGDTLRVMDKEDLTPQGEALLDRTFNHFCSHERDIQVGDDVYTLSERRQGYVSRRTIHQFRPQGL